MTTPTSSWEQEEEAIRHVIWNALQLYAEANGTTMKEEAMRIHSDAAIRFLDHRHAVRAECERIRQEEKRKQREQKQKEKKQ